MSGWGSSDGRSRKTASGGFQTPPTNDLPTSNPAPKPAPPTSEEKKDSAAAGGWHNPNLTE